NEFRKINSEVNELIKNYADDDSEVFFLSIGDKFLQEDGTLSKSIMPDLLHPNSEGYQIWAEAMEPTIQKLLSTDGK
ncbi:MAG: acetylglucosamine-6-sulfatase, partial [Planctomycetaceae bacterium]|nr:acetylglucosamine-6-sulfatase [Planctomycetaceae bacterium]